MDASEGGVTEETNQLRLMTERQQQRQGAVILPEMLISDHFQVSAHSCPRALVRELCHVFPGVDFSVGAVAIPTIQHAEQDLVRVGAEIETEKDRCLENVGIAQKLLIQDQLVTYVAP